MFHGFSGTEDRRTERGKDREGREGGEGDGDKGKGAKKRRKSSSGKHPHGWLEYKYMDLYLDIRTS